jgi:hypothetical protein
MNFCTFQISQCRITVDLDKTAEFYSRQNLIVDDCDSKYCKYFTEEVVHKEIRIFKILKNMGVDLVKNENNHPDGLWHTGDSDKFNNSYIQHYKIFGIIGKTQLSTLRINEKGLKSVEYFESTSDSFCRYIFSQLNSEEIECQINLECDRK